MLFGYSKSPNSITESDTVNVIFKRETVPIKHERLKVGASCVCFIVVVTVHVLGLS